jgi:hypothetical protein
MTDFFISYTSPDEAWAEWIGWKLEQADFDVVMQKWDFAAGSNFVLEMHKAAASADRTIAVLSPEYLTKSRFGSAEWAAAFAKDPDGSGRKLVPVRVRPCAADGLLTSIVHVDLVGLEEDEAQRTLLDEVRGARRKPSTAPSFPGGGRATTTPRPFPGPGSSVLAKRYMPKIRHAATDLDKRRFSKETFNLLHERFEQWLGDLSASHSGVDVNVEKVDANTFTAEVFIEGQCKGSCKIWIGGMFGGNDIAYAEGARRVAVGGNSVNEALMIIDGRDGLALRATMNMGIGRAGEGLDPQCMSPEESAQFLWRRFCWTFEQ